MHPTAYLVLSVLVFFSVLIAIVVRFYNGLTDVVVLFCLVFGLFYGFRGLLLAAGLDTPYPDRFFTMSQAPALAATTLLWLTAFLTCFAIGAYVTSELARPTTTLFFARKVPPTSRLVFVTVVLTILATLVSGALVAQHGGIGGFIRAVKFDKSLTGLYFLRVPASTGAILSVATFLQLIKNSNLAIRSAAMLVLICALLDGFLVFIWGQRSALVVLGVILVIGLVSNQQGKAGRRPLTAIVALIAAVGIVLGVSTGLRYARDELVSGEVQTVVAKASLARQVSIGTNSIYFDSSMLAFRDWPSAYSYRDGQDFALGAAGFVPRILWAGKPAQVKTGAWFRQQYQPNIRNGWPIGVPTEWWLDFGPLGVLLGGLISGLVFGVIRRAQMNSAASGLNLSIALVCAVYVFQTGMGPEFPVYFTVWLVPLWLIVWFLQLDLTNFRSASPPGAMDGPPVATESTPRGPGVRV